jgi:hypothetical protein
MQHTRPTTPHRRAARLAVSALLALALLLTTAAYAPTASAESHTTVNGYPGQSVLVVTRQLPLVATEIRVVVQTCGSYGCYLDVYFYNTLRCGQYPCDRHTWVGVGGDTSIVEIGVYGWSSYLVTYY